MGMVHLNRTKWPSFPEHAKLKGKYDSGKLIVEARIDNWEPFCGIKQGVKDLLGELFAKLVPNIRLAEAEVMLFIDLGSGLEKVQFIAVIDFQLSPKEILDEIYGDNIKWFPDAEK